MNTNSVRNKKPNGQYKLSISPVVQPQLRSQSPKREYRSNVQCNVAQDNVGNSVQGSNIDEWQHTQRENIPDMVMGLNPIKQNSKVAGSNLANRHSGSSVSDDSAGGESPLPCQRNQLKNSGMVTVLNPINHNDRVSGSNLVHCSNSVSDDIAGGGGLLPIYDVNSVGVEENLQTA